MRNGVTIPADNVLAAWLKLGQHLGIDHDDLIGLLADQVTAEVTAQLMTRPRPDNQA